MADETIKATYLPETF